MDKFIREGGQTIYDLGSSTFNEELLEPNKRKEEKYELSQKLSHQKRARSREEVCQCKTLL